jgi:hypothetical protein
MWSFQLYIRRGSSRKCADVNSRFLPESSEIIFLRNYFCSAPDDDVVVSATFSEPSAESRVR